MGAHHNRAWTEAGGIGGKMSAGLRDCIFKTALAACVLCAGCGQQARMESSDEAFNAGWERYRLGDYPAAIRAFELSVKLATNDAQKVRGDFSLADAWNYRSPGRSAEKAARFYNKVIAEDATGEWAPWAALALVRQKVLVAIEEPPDIKVLEEGYGGVIQNYPGHDAAAEAFLFLQSARLMRGDKENLEKAIEALEAWFPRNMDSVYAGHAQGFLGRGYSRQGQGRKWIDALVTGAELGRKQERKWAEHANLPQSSQAQNYFSIAMVAQLSAGDFELAREYYKKFFEESPTDQRVYLAEKMLERMEAFEEEVRRELENVQ